jgi:hypothetical protein
MRVEQVTGPEVHLGNGPADVGVAGLPVRMFAG